ncbi:MAG TPA: hypothetical protein VEA41_18410 [Salinarimonas sp.]|nr:hypothetical protein [Salinarimonas sp.]
MSTENATATPAVQETAPVDKATPATEAPKDAAPAEPEADPKTAARLARIARAEAKVREREKALEAREKTSAERLEKFQKFEEAKTKGGRLAALRVLFDEGEITGELFQELTDHVYSSYKQPTAEELARKAAREELEARQKADQEAKTKAAQERETEVRSTYLGVAQKSIEAEPGRWPLIANLGVSGQDILDKVEAHFRETGTALSPDEALDLAEKELESKVSKTGKYATQIEKPKADETTEKPKEPVSASMSRDVPVKERKPASLRESLEEAKRQAGILK